MNRNVQIGDMVIQNGDVFSHLPTKEVQYFGIVYKIDIDKYGYAGHVFLKWTPEPPPEYDAQYGYSSMNIHNQRRQFDIIKRNAK